MTDESFSSKKTNLNKMLFSWYGHNLTYSDGSGSKIFDPGLVGSIFLLLGLGQPSMVWVWKISPKMSNFSFFPL